MRVARVVAHGLEHDDLEGQVEPRHVDEQREEQHDDPCVECQDVGIFHQRQTGRAEALLERLGDAIGVALAHQGIELLELGRLALLPARVVAIKIKVDFVEPFLAVPRQGAHQGALLGIGVQLASRFTLEEIQVDVAVIVGQGALLGMAVETRVGREKPHPDAPRAAPRRGFRREAQAEEKIDGEEPHVAGKPVQYAADERLLSRHAGQLPVGAVVPVSPNEEKHSDEVHVQVIRPEKVTGQCAYDDGHQRDGDRVDVQPLEQQGPKVTRRARDVKFESPLRVFRFHRGQYTFFQSG